MMLAACNPMMMHGDGHGHGGGSVNMNMM